MGGLVMNHPRASKNSQNPKMTEYSLYILSYTGYLYRQTAISEVTNKKAWDRNKESKLLTANFENIR